MTRAFADRPLDPDTLDTLLAAAARAPRAGATEGVDLLCLSTDGARRRFWEAASEAHWRESGAQAPGLLAAPVVVVPVADPAAYVARYGAPDKAASGLSGRAAAEWDVPYWLVDAALATMTILLGATDAGLGALFFRLHRPEAVLLDAFGVPPGRRTIGALALGYPAGTDRRAPRLRAPRRPLAEVVHAESW